MIIEDVPKNQEDLINMIIFNPPHIFLTPVTTSQVFLHGTRLKFLGINSALSTFIDFLEMSSILSKIKLETRPIFQCFRCFDHNIWTLILMSILSISLLSSLPKIRIKSFYEYSWTYSISLIGVSIQHFIKLLRRRWDIMIACWLIAASLLNMTFHTYFFDQMVSPTPVTKIDSIDDLFDSDLTILARHDSALYSYLHSINSTLLKRLDTYEDKDKIKNKLFDGLKKGSMAYINHKFVIIFFILEMFEYYRHEGFNANEIIDQFHISRDDGGTEPCFQMINENLDIDIKNDLTIM